MNLTTRQVREGAGGVGGQAATRLRLRRDGGRQGRRGRRQEARRDQDLWGEVTRDLQSKDLCGREAG